MAIARAQRVSQREVCCYSCRVIAPALSRSRAPPPARAACSPHVALGATRPAAGHVMPATQGRQEEGSGVCAAGPKVPAGHGVGEGEPAGQ